MSSENIKEFFITWGVILFINQLFIFGGCFAPYCIVAALPHTGIIAWFVFYHWIKDAEREKEAEEEFLNQLFEKTPPKKEIDPLKAKGDKYEKFIGRKFEEKGELVIYNGFINGYKDKGVDIISISLETKSINLIQCKNWTRKPMMLDDVKDIYEKLAKYNIRHITQEFNAISKHLQIEKSPEEVRVLLSQMDRYNYAVRKTLYASSDKVIDLNIGKHLKF